MDADKMPEVCVLCLCTIVLPPRAFPVCAGCLEQLRLLPEVQRMERSAAVVRAVETRLQRESNERLAESIRQAAFWAKEAAAGFSDILKLAKDHWRDSSGGDDPLGFDDLR